MNKDYLIFITPFVKCEFDVSEGPYIIISDSSSIVSRSKGSTSISSLVSRKKCKTFSLSKCGTFQKTVEPSSKKKISLTEIGFNSSFSSYDDLTQIQFPSTSSVSCT